MTIVNDDARVINKLEASLTDDTRVVIYDHHMFIVQATGDKVIELFYCSLTKRQIKLDRLSLVSFSSPI
jgi:hypothetical protein